MFDIGFWELFFLFLLALFVLGPERLPAVASYLGKQFGKVQRYFSNVKVILREVVLKNKPKEMLLVSEKATVPILSLIHI